VESPRGRCDLEYHMLHNAEYRMFSSVIVIIVSRIEIPGNLLYLDIDLPDQSMLITGKSPRGRTCIIIKVPLENPPSTRMPETPSFTDVTSTDC
jgi:hypothetical protein